MADDPAGEDIQAVGVTGRSGVQGSTGILRVAIEIIAMRVTGAAKPATQQVARKRAGRPTLTTLLMHNGLSAPIMDSTRSGRRVKHPVPL